MFPCYMSDDLGAILSHAGTIFGTMTIYLNHILVFFFELIMIYNLHKEVYDYYDHLQHDNKVLLQEIRDLKFHRMRRNVEFALHPQHETSLDSGINIIEDFNQFKSRSRIRPRSRSMVSLNSNGWGEYWSTKIIPNNERNSNRRKLEQSKD